MCATRKLKRLGWSVGKRDKAGENTWLGQATSVSRPCFRLCLVGTKEPWNIWNPNIQW